MANITAWVKKVWKDRKTEYPTRRTLTKTNGSQEIVTVARNEGNVSQEGDAFSAANMNDLEERIDAGFTALTGKLGDSFKIRVLTKETTAGSSSSSFGGNVGYVDITNDISDIKDRIISIIPVSYGERDFSSLGGFCFMQSDTVVRVCSNRTGFVHRIKITIIYT